MKQPTSNNNETLSNTKSTASNDERDRQLYIASDLRQHIISWNNPPSTDSRISSSRNENNNNNTLQNLLLSTIERYERDIRLRDKFASAAMGAASMAVKKRRKENNNSNAADDNDDDDDEKKNSMEEEHNRNSNDSNNNGQNHHRETVLSTLKNMVGQTGNNKKDGDDDDNDEEGNNNEMDDDWNDIEPNQIDAVDTLSITSSSSSTLLPSSSSAVPPLIQYLNRNVIYQLGANNNNTYSNSTSTSIHNTATNNNNHLKPILISTPVGAIAVAIHAMFLSNPLQFKCTGCWDYKMDDYSYHWTGTDSSGSSDSDNGNSTGNIANWINNYTNKSTKVVTKGGGFAPPVRELDPTIDYLPDGWDQYAQADIVTQNRSSRKKLTTTTTATTDPVVVCLRYRKKGLGSVLLSILERCVEDDTTTTAATAATTTTTSANENHNNRIEIRYGSGPSGNRDPSSVLLFPSYQHVNPKSLQLALESSIGKGGVSPPMHYKKLSGLLDNCIREFDLGDIVEGYDNCSNGVNYNINETIPYDYNVHSGLNPTIHNEHDNYHRNNNNNNNNDNDNNNKNNVGNDLLPNHPHPHPYPHPHPLPSVGPTGIINADPTSINNTAANGNLVGPNHPIFNRQFGDCYDDWQGGIGGGSGIGGGRGIGGIGGIRGPRFDMYLPPGVGDVDDGRRGGRGGGRGRLGGRGRGGRGRNVPGEPDPDHLRPPSSFDHDMFR